GGACKRAQAPARRHQARGARARPRGNRGIGAAGRAPGRRHVRRLRPQRQWADRDGLRRGGLRRHGHAGEPDGARQGAGGRRRAAAVRAAPLRAQVLSKRESMATERFTKDHEWIRVEGGVGTVGITDHAQTQLGDIVFVEVPEVGRKAAQGEAIAVVESVKAASDVYAPVAGGVVEVNGDLSANSALVNEDAQGKAWFFKIKAPTPADLDKLMDRAAYEAFVKESN